MTSTTTAAATAAGTLPVAAIAVLAGILLAAVVGRRRFAPGVADGLFVAALSGLLIVNTAAPAVEALRGAAAGIGLAALAGWWVLAAHWLEGPASSHVPGSPRHVRASLALFAAVLVGLLALPALHQVDRHPWPGPAAAAAAAALLVAVAAITRSAFPAPLSRYVLVAASAVFGLLLLHWAKIPDRLAPASASAVLLLIAAAAAALWVGWKLADWRARVRAWVADPLADLPAQRRRPLLGALVVAAALVVGVGAVFVHAQPVTPVALAVAGLTTTAVGHRRRSTAIGALGLLLATAAIASAASAWLPSAKTNTLAGLGLAGCFLAWLGRFWDQQLRAGRPWTTAGRLVHPARHLSMLAAGAEFSMSAWWLLTPADSAVRAGPTWLALLAFAAPLLHFRLLTVDARRHGDPAPALAALLPLLAGLAALRLVFLALTPHAPATLAPWLGAAALLVALPAARVAPAGGLAWTYDALLGGLLPVALASDVLVRQAWHTEPAATTVGVALLAVAWAWRATAPHPRPPMARAP